ncbi:hypothetical protein FBEOM_10687 [Fusarium beomiforme]|uniref:Uncharacterized protein n=1 Tax=Fusarium beomiforme TaxID=44412 RepID=A0A9P5AAW2_9HYPO|nr:hypothetical protein FBEOM_10687 [Fusarium beomiforme]
MDWSTYVWVNLGTITVSAIIQTILLSFFEFPKERFDRMYWVHFAIGLVIFMTSNIIGDMLGRHVAGRDHPHHIDHSEDDYADSTGSSGDDGEHSDDDDGTDDDDSGNDGHDSRASMTPTPEYESSCYEESTDSEDAIDSELRDTENMFTTLPEDRSSMSTEKVRSK